MQFKFSFIVILAYPASPQPVPHEFFNKKDFSNIVIKGIKQIVNWVPNPSNGLQINWKHEFDATPIDNTFEETYNIIVDKITECWIKKDSQHTTAIADYNKRHESQKQ